MRNKSNVDGKTLRYILSGSVEVKDDYTADSGKRVRVLYAIAPNGIEWVVMEIGGDTVAAISGHKVKQ